MGHMYDVKVEVAVSNSYRDAMIDRICWEVFGTTNPSRTQVIDKYSFLFGGMFSKGTQGRADISRALRQQVGELVEGWSASVPPRHTASVRRRGRLRPPVRERGLQARRVD